MDPILNTFTVSLHILAALILIGHVLFWTTAVGSITERANASVSNRTLDQIMRSTGWLSWACLCVLIVTGILMLPNWHVTLEKVISGQLFRTRFGQLLAAKLLGVVLIIIGFVFVAPRTKRLWRFNFFLGLIVILLSVLLVR